MRKSFRNEAKKGLGKAPCKFKNLDYIILIEQFMKDFFGESCLEDSVRIIAHGLLNVIRLDKIYRKETSGFISYIDKSSLSTAKEVDLLVNSFSMGKFLSGPFKSSVILILDILVSRGY